MDYSKQETPKDYVCDGCGKHGIKLWRQYQAFSSFLLCLTCAAGHQKKTVLETTDKGRVRIAEHHDPEAFTDQIGWYVPAVPDEEGNGYWGYTSVPDAAVQWWQGLQNN